MSRIPLNLIISTVLLATSLGACGGDSKSAETPTDFFNSLRDSVCSYEVECGTMPDLATCEAVTPFGKEQVTVIAYVDAGKVVYDADKAKACLDFVDGLSCTISIFDIAAEFTEKCGVVLTGSVAAGNACVVAEECVAGGDCQQTGSCDTETQCCAGTCTAPASTDEVALGGDCSTNRNCVDGAYCKVGATSAICTAQVDGEGTACDDFDACKAPLICSIGFTGTGTCYKPAASGATCDSNAFLPCASSTDYCDATDMKCKTRGKPGDDCDANSDQSCVEYAACVDAKCVARPAAGGACTGDASDSNCLGALVCGTDGKCALPPTPTACP
jgi:hypothetical protein